MDHQDLPPQHRLPGQGEPGPDEARAASRDRGIRQVRRLSNWTAVALVAATAVTAGYFARGGAGGGAAAGTARSAAVTGVSSQATGSHQQPCVTVPVATSGGSGVTTTTMVPSSSCATGSTGSRPAVIYVKSGGEREDQ